MISDNGLQPTWFVGIVEFVESGNDGRLKVRCFGFHPTQAAGEVKHEDLPWAHIINTSFNKISVWPEVGSFVFGFFLDGRDAQQPCVLGTINSGIMTSLPYNTVTAARQITPETTNGVSPGYPADMTQAQIEDIIRKEAIARGMDPEAAITVFRHEGAGSYQSTFARTGTGSLNGREASFGPYQLFTGGGLGNEYETLTGRNLISDNTVDGITNQIRFALDRAATNGWGAWYGAAAGGIGDRDGLSGAHAIGNWN